MLNENLTAVLTRLVVSSASHCLVRPDPLTARTGGRVRQVHAFFRHRTQDQILATAAPHSSPWLPDSYGQNLRQVALELSAERAHGAHTYLVTPEHTAKARAQLGPAPWLIVEQAVVLEADAAKARDIGRRHVSHYLDLPNYTNNLHRLGFTAQDTGSNGSDRLVDSLVAWGGLEMVATRLDDHLAAGADQICVQVFDPDPHGLPLWQWRECPSLLGSCRA